MSLRDNFNLLGKTKKVHKFFCSNEKRKLQKIDNYGNESVVIIPYKIKFIDSAIFMANSLSNLVDNLAVGILKIKCKECDCFLNMKMSRAIW